VRESFDAFQVKVFSATSAYSSRCCNTTRGV
jgi:hypothetical protein